MTRSRKIVKGSAILVGGQVVTAVAQICYSGFASRHLASRDFAAYAVALSATGLAALLLTTGLPAMVLADRDFEPSRAALVNLLAAASAAVTLVGLITLAPMWARLWGSPESTSLLRTLAVFAAVSAVSSVQLALLRREGRPTADACIQVSAALTGMSAGALVIETTHQRSALVVSPTVAVALSLLLAWLLRRQRFPWAKPSGWQEIGSFARKVSAQNVGFFLIMSSPQWAVSRAAGAVSLGQYSRASLMSYLPSNALSTALVRALQPHYRHLSGVQQQVALADATVCATAAAAPPFLLLACVADELVPLWLGPGWGTAATLASPLALGYGVSVVFTVLANAAETLSMFVAVRRSQVGMALGALVGVVTVLLTGRVEIAAWTLPCMAVLALVLLLHELGRRGAIGVTALRAALATQLAWDGSIVLASWVVALLSVQGRHSSTSRDLQVVVVAAALTAVGLVVTTKRQPVGVVLRRRGLLVATTGQR